MTGVPDGWVSNVYVFENDVPPCNMSNDTDGEDNATASAGGVTTLAAAPKWKIKVWIRAFIPGFLPGVKKDGHKYIPSGIGSTCGITNDRSFSNNLKASSKAQSEITVN